MKRIFSFCLAALLFCLPAGAAPAAAAAVEYEKLPELVAAHSPAVLEVVQTYTRLSHELASLQKKHNELMDSNAPLSVIAPLAQPIQDAMRELKTAIAHREADLDAASKGQVYAARTLFITHYLLAEDVSIARLLLEEAQEALRAGRVKFSAGLLPRRSLTRLERAVTDQTDAVSEAEKQCSANLTALADLLGIAAPIALGALPEADFAAIKTRDLEADLKAYTLSAPNVREKKALMDKAKDARDLSAAGATLYAYTIARENYETAKTLAARDFPTVYHNLLDAYERYALSSLVQQAQEDLQDIRARQAAGSASRNMVASAERALALAECMARKEALALRLALAEYEYNLIAQA